MSLLMQALKKAERAKQSHHGEEEAPKPSEAFDSLLELAPQEPLAPAQPREEPDPAPVLPPEGLSLSPLDAAPQEPALEFVPQEPVRSAAPPVEDKPIPAPPPPPPPPPSAPPQARRPRNAPPPPPQAPARPRARATPVLSARTIRMAALGAGALVVASAFGYIYWHEMYGPGSSRHLPPVPMPGQNLPPAAPAPGGASLVGPAVIGGSPLGEAPVGVAAAPAAPDLPPAGVTGYPAPANVASVPAAPAVQATGPGSSRGEPPPDAYMGPPATGPGSSRGLPPPDAYMGPAASAAPAPAPVRSAPAAPTVAAPPANNDIRVARASNPEMISPGVAAGYGAYQRGDLPGARAYYQDALRQDPNSRDALLGLAAVSVRAGEPEQAGSYYARLLEIDPNDADALAGMSALRGTAGGDADGERRLRQAAEKNPDSGPAQFALGNLYARQGRWSEAQQHYFRAYTSAPQNPDYAYNLAVGLDRLNQGRLALGYYQRALALAGSGPAGFDRAAARARVRELGAR